MSTQVQVIQSEKPVLALLQPRQSDLIQMMGGEMEYKKEISFAIQAANSNDILAGCHPSSVAKAIFNLAITGLSLNPVKKLAYLIPKNIKGQWQAILMPSYQGLAHLIMQGGEIQKIVAHVVYEGDEFEYELGFDVHVKHVPKLSATKKMVVAAYALAIDKNGAKYAEVMSKQELDEIKERSDSGKKNTGPWVSDYPEMCRKTCIRRIYKYLPKGANAEAVGEAIKIDEEDYPATQGQINYIESLLQNSNIDHEERGSIEREFDDMTAGRAEEVIQYLKDNQLDPITAGTNYSSTDIQKKIQTEIPLDEQEDKK